MAMMSSKSSSVATVNCSPVWGGTSGRQVRLFSIFIVYCWQWNRRGIVWICFLFLYLFVVFIYHLCLLHDYMHHIATVYIKCVCLTLSLIQDIKVFEKIPQNSLTTRYCNFHTQAISTIRSAQKWSLLHVKSAYV